MSQDPMEYLEQAKANMQAMAAAAEMQANQANMAHALRARLEQLDALAASTSTPGPAATCLSAEDRVRFGLDSTLNSTSRSAKAQAAPRTEARRTSGSTAAPGPGYPAGPSA